jgi:two-component system, cell cycle response regulator
MIKPPSVLVVDDNPDITMLLCAVLEGAGYRPVSAHNGTEGLAALRRESFSAVLCDASMPVMNGLDLLRDMRLDPTLPPIPFILMSGSPATPAGEYTPTAFLLKPFKMSHVVETVTAALAQVAVH